jgi:phosphoglycolate phosphatase
MGFENVFFDLDGTLCDSFRGIKKGIVFSCEKLGQLVPSDEEIRKMIGTPLVISMKNYFNGDENLSSRAVLLFREYYEKEGIYDCELYDGVPEMLEELIIKANLFLVTAKPVIYAQRLLQFKKIDQHFNHIMGCSLNGKALSKTEHILSQKVSGVSVIIGDKEQDIVAGKNSGIQSIGVLYGYGSNDELSMAGANYIVGSVKELRMLLIK